MIPTDTTSGVKKKADPKAVAPAQDPPTKVRAVRQATVIQPEVVDEEEVAEALRRKLNLKHTPSVEDSSDDDDDPPPADPFDLTNVRLTVHVLDEIHTLKPSSFPNLTEVELHLMAIFLVLMGMPAVRKCG